MESQPSQVQGPLMQKWITKARTTTAHPLSSNLPFACFFFIWLFSLPPLSFLLTYFLFSQYLPSDSFPFLYILFHSIRLLSLSFLKLHFASFPFPSFPFSSLAFPSLPFSFLPFPTFPFSSILFHFLPFSSLPFPSVPLHFLSFSSHHLQFYFTIFFPFPFLPTSQSPYRPHFLHTPLATFPTPCSSLLATPFRPALRERRERREK